MIIAVDFDGVLHQRSEGDPFLGRQMPGALPFIQALVATGHRVIIHTARANTSDGHAAVNLWLRRNEFPVLEVTHLKPAAAVFIDDRAYRFEGDFDAALAFVHSLSA